MKNRVNDLIGVVGGMGPVASAAFIQTIYECCETHLPEQKKPNIVLFSDPSAPARDEENIAPLENFILDKLTTMNELGAITSIVCCFVANILLPKIEGLINLGEQVISLTEENSEYIVLGSSLLVENTLLDKYFKKMGVKRNLAYLPTNNQEKLMELIYKIKSGVDISPDLLWFENILHKQDKKFIIACGEIHIAHKKLGYYSHIIDPFLEVAKSISLTK
jgi:aspartate racemase